MDTLWPAASCSSVPCAPYHGGPYPQATSQNHLQEASVRHFVRTTRKGTNTESKLREEIHMCIELEGELLESEERGGEETYQGWEKVVHGCIVCLTDHAHIWPSYKPGENEMQIWDIDLCWNKWLKSKAGMSLSLFYFVRVYIASYLFLLLVRKEGKPWAQSWLTGTLWRHARVVHYEEIKSTIPLHFCLGHDLSMPECQEISQNIPRP